ncbi:MAG: hypothetical protein PHE06_02485 [Lachnospiraceae bacterium]|nr:hypothetical protein [Lachnospiraceae bacterium]
MKRLIGYSLFCIAIGMLIGLFISSILLQALIIFLLLLIGYNLFVC